MKQIGCGKNSRDDQSNIVWKNAILGFWERLGEQAESGHSVLTPEQRAFFATPADPLAPDGPTVYNSTPEHNTTLHRSGGLLLVKPGWPQMKI